ncbi:hypothetical protein HDU93_006941 [Gonapodya sp. JEL0774]|nr:hypothetical protein HDU93_006941 [Gonapodya sp. JEL0774]
MRKRVQSVDREEADIASALDEMEEHPKKESEIATKAHDESPDSYIGSDPFGSHAPSIETATAAALPGSASSDAGSFHSLQPPSPPILRVRPLPVAISETVLKPLHHYLPIPHPAAKSVASIGGTSKKEDMRFGQVTSLENVVGGKDRGTEDEARRTGFIIPPLVDIPGTTLLRDANPLIEDPSISVSTNQLPPSTTSRRTTSFAIPAAGMSSVFESSTMPSKQPSVVRSSFRQRPNLITPVASPDRPKSPLTLVGSQAFPSEPLPSSEIPLSLPQSSSISGGHGPRLQTTAVLLSRTVNMHISWDPPTTSISATPQSTRSASLSLALLRLKSPMSLSRGVTPWRRVCAELVVSYDVGRAERAMRTSNGAASSAARGDGGTKPLPPLDAAEIQIWDVVKVATGRGWEDYVSSYSCLSSECSAAQE